ncbi:ATP-dependent helicase, partial [bacterium]|nr:ATP-dependent helicase [bacterium]
MPYDAGHKQLLQAFDDVGCSFKIKKRDKRQAVAWLPTKGKQPIASNPLVDAPPASRHKIKIAPWTVSALVLDREQTITLLCHVAGKTRIAPGALAGNDLAYWSIVMRYAGSLTARQQFLPGVIQKNRKFYACWNPIVVGDDKKRQAELISAMPGACRAITLQPDT